MAYSRDYGARIGWKNFPSTDTAVDEDNLGKMDYAIFEHDKKIVDLDGRLIAKDEEFNNVKAEAQEYADLSKDYALESKAFSEVSSDEANRAYNEAERAKEYAEQASGGSTEDIIEQISTELGLTKDNYNGTSAKLKINSAPTSDSYNGVWFSNGNADGQVYSDTEFIYNPVTNTLIVPNVNGKCSKATADANGNNIASTYATKEELKQASLVDITTTTSRELADSEAGGIRIISMDGESQQATYSGKNLLPNNATSKTVDGMSFTVNENGSVAVDGTSTAIIYYPIDGGMSGNKIPIPEWLEKGKEYIISSSPNVIIYLFKEDGTYYNYSNQKFTVPDDAMYYGVHIRFNSGVTMTKTTFYPMIRLASITEGTYEPYVGGIASPNPEYEQSIDSVEVSEISSHGKNYLKNTAKTQTINGVTFTVNDDGSVLVNGTASAKATFIINSNVKLKKGKYIFAKNYRPYNVNNGVDRNKDGRYEVVAASHGAEFEVTEETEDRTFTFYVQVVANATVNNVTFYPLLRKSSDDDTYEPYTETKEELSAPIVLRKDDVLNKNNGTFGTSRKQGYALFDGSSDESWLSAGAVVGDKTYYRYKISLQNANANASRSFCLCNRAIYSATSNEVGACFVYGSEFFICTPHKTVDEFKAWIVSKNVEVVYPLATPTFEPLPLADQIALHKLESFGGVTYLFTDSTIEPIIEVEYGTSKVGGYAIKGLNTADANALMIEQLKTLTNELATQIVAGSEA